MPSPRNQNRHQPPDPSPNGAPSIQRHHDLTVGDLVGISFDWDFRAEPDGSFWLDFSLTPHDPDGPLPQAATTGSFSSPEEFDTWMEQLTAQIEHLWTSLVAVRDQYAVEYGKVYLVKLIHATGRTLTSEARASDPQHAVVTAMSSEVVRLLGIRETERLRGEGRRYDLWRESGFEVNVRGRWQSVVGVTAYHVRASATTRQPDDPYAVIYGVAGEGKLVAEAGSRLFGRELPTDEQGRGIVVAWPDGHANQAESFSYRVERSQTALTVPVQHNSAPKQVGFLERLGFRRKEKHHAT